MLYWYQLTIVEYGLWKMDWFSCKMYIINNLLEVLDFAHGTLIIYVHAEFAALEMEDGEEGLGGQEEADPHQPASYTWERCKVYVRYLV